MDWRDRLEGWIGGMEWREVLEGRIGGTAWRDGLEGRIGGMNWRDGLEGWIKEMDCRDGQRIGQGDGQIKGWRDVVLLYLFYFREKQKFSYFRRKSIFAKSEIFAFSWAIFAKNENDFCSYFRENFAKIYFRPNSTMHTIYSQPVGGKGC
jgi:hypothetical protein